MKFTTTLVFLFSIYATTIFLSGCSSNELTRQLTAEEYFLKGKESFLDGNYLEAIENFKVVGLQYSGSEFADDAQFYLGECYFQREEYLLSAFEYESLKKRMASSPYVPLAMYKMALSYFQLSPKSLLDQKYTRKAIDELQAFLEYYPQHDSAQQAGEKIRLLNNRLAQKEFEIAELYFTLEEYQAAIHYFENVLAQYHDSKYAEQAQLGIVSSWFAKKKYDKASNEVKKFFEKYPDSNFKQKAESLQKEILEGMRESSLMQNENEKYLNE
ncbi:MAG: outer membrane protein assembly factor BamD [Bacteroidota bacterium]